MEETKYYIGLEAVKEFTVFEGIDLVGVLYENGKTEDYTIEQWEALKSEVPYETGEISNRKHNALMVRILKQLVKARVTLGEQEWILERISITIGENYRKAIAKLFDQSLPEKIMLAQIDGVLKDGESKDKTIKE